MFIGNHFCRGLPPSTRRSPSAVRINDDINDRAPSPIVPNKIVYEILPDVVRDDWLETTDNSGSCGVDSSAAAAAPVFDFCAGERCLSIERRDEHIASLIDFPPPHHETQAPANFRKTMDSGHGTPATAEEERNAELKRLLQNNDALHRELAECKDAIQRYAHNKKWDRYKKITNDYEMISSSFPDAPSVSAYNPISRSFYKLWEILVDFENDIIKRPRKPMRAVFLAEGPGGFVEAFALYRRRFFPELYYRDSLHGMTLQTPDRHIPRWNLPESDRYRMRVHGGEDGTGNLYDTRNISHMVAGVGRSSCDLVTADGGFDFSGNFNTQEECSGRLVASEIYAGLQLLRKHGTFVLKMYDMRTVATLSLVALLRRYFKRLLFVKPCTSRPANSEKYLVCLTFKTVPDAPAFFHSFRKKLDALRGSSGDGDACFGDVAAADDEVFFVPPRSPPSSEGQLATSSLHPSFVRCVVDFNREYISRQTSYIKKTIDLILATPSIKFDTHEGRVVLRKQYSKCLRWCARYAIPTSQTAVAKYHELCCSTASITEENGASPNGSSP